MKLKLKKLFAIPEFKNKFLLTLLILFFYRFLGSFPIPGIPREALKQLFEQAPSLQVLSNVSGGMLEQISILSIGLGPYINASYILQLLAVIVPQIKELQEGGPIERKILSGYTRLLSFPLAIFQSLVIYTLLSRNFVVVPSTRIEVVSIIAMLVFGAMITMWLGDIVSQFGLGGGNSIIIIAGILVNIPANLRKDFSSVGALWKQGVMVFMLLLIFVLAVVLSLAIRKIQLVSARRVRSTGFIGGDNHIPVQINPAGVMPVIFAISILDLPRLFFSFMKGQDRIKWLASLSTKVLPIFHNDWFYNTGLFLVILFFAYFSAFLVFKPKEIADNLAKSGSFVEGIRPGKETEKHLYQVVLKTVFFGAVLLALLSVLPSVILKALNLPELMVSGTGALIVASVIIDIIRHAESLYTAHQEPKEYY